MSTDYSGTNPNPHYIIYDELTKATGTDYDKIASQGISKASETFNLLDALMDFDWTTLCPIVVRLLASPKLSVETRSRILTQISSYQLAKQKDLPF